MSPCHPDDPLRVKVMLFLLWPLDRVTYTDAADTKGPLIMLQHSDNENSLFGIMSVLSGVHVALTLKVEICKPTTIEKKAIKQS